MNGAPRPEEASRHFKAAVMLPDLGRVPKRRAADSIRTSYRENPEISVGVFNRCIVCSQVRALSHSRSSNPSANAVR